MLPMAEPVQCAFLAGDGFQREDALHRLQGVPVQRVIVRVARQRDAWKFVPPHVAHDIQGPVTGSLR